MTTIFALSSGAPPAAIGVIRISGPGAGEALDRLCGSRPPPREAALRTVRDGAGRTLDRALVLWFAGPASATGEDCAEIHCHGGRAVIRAIETALSEITGLEPAAPGAFTRRAFANGRIDLAEAEGLADLLSAETELQRRVAQANVGGALSRCVDRWREEVLALSAQVEAALDFSDEEDGADLSREFGTRVGVIAGEIGSWLARPAAEMLRDGLRVVLAGPPNAGKSTLFNAMLQSDAAIVSPIAGTTRDVIERPVSFDGVPFVLVDTAGLRETANDAIETIGIARASRQVEGADIVLWLGAEGEGPSGAFEIETAVDLDRREKRLPDYRVSGVTQEGLAELILGLVAHARELLPKPGEGAVNQRQRALLAEATETLASVRGEDDPLLIGENLRRARIAFDRLLGTASTEDMLDALFGRFCIGK